MHFPLLSHQRVRDAAFFALFLAYTWLGMDPRLMYHWQLPVFSTIPGFASSFLQYPGGIADYVYALAAQAYVHGFWGAALITAQVAAVAALTGGSFRLLAGRPVPLAHLAPAFPLLYILNLYYDRTPVLLALILGLGLGVIHLVFARRRPSEVTLLGSYALMLAAAYYAGGVAMLFFAAVAAAAAWARHRRGGWWVAYVLLAVGLPMVAERAGWFTAAPARSWFSAGGYRGAAYCSLYAFYGLGAGLAAWKGLGAAQSKEVKRNRLVAAAVTAGLMLTLGAAAAACYESAGRDRRPIALDYYAANGDWAAVLEAAPHLRAGEFNNITSYDINLALHESHRLGDEMFRYPQTGAMLLSPGISSFLSYMIKVTDMCLRLGRVNEAERLGSEAIVISRSDPRVCRLMADVNLVKGQMEAARKFLTVLSYDLGSGGWARGRLEEMERDPQLAGDSRIALLRKRMLRTDDMLAVWQRTNRSEPDLERLLLDQLDQDPSNRMAFEYLMGTYLIDVNLEAAQALLPRIKYLTGPGYVLPDGRRRTPRYYQEAMALLANTTGKLPECEGFVVDRETLQRLETFKQLMLQASTKEAGKSLAWNGYRDSYYFFATFGPGDYR
jgi:hypothetical protein